MQVGEISKHDQDYVQTRIKSKSFWAVGFGPYGGLSSDSVIYNFSIGHNWEPGTNADIRVTLDAMAGKSVSMATLTLGSGYFFSRGELSPYLAGELGGGYGDTDDKSSVAGFAGKVALGMRMFRASSTQLDVGLNYNVVFAEGAPGAYGAQLKILF